MYQFCLLIKILIFSSLFNRCLTVLHYEYDISPNTFMKILKNKVYSVELLEVSYVD